MLWRVSCCSHRSSFSLEFEIDSGKSIEKPLSTERKSIHGNNCDAFQRGRPVDSLKLVFSTRRRTGGKAKAKVSFLSHLRRETSLHLLLLLLLQLHFSLPFPQSFDKSADKRDSVLISGHPPLLEVSTFFIIYY